MKQTITKLIIPCAGFGTRFLPATKAVPKPLLPVLGKPTIQWVVEEAIASGIKEIIFVIMKGHEAIIDHFSYNPKLYAHLKKFNKLERLGNIEDLRKKVKFNFIYQKHFYGTAYPVLDAEQCIGNKPFAVVWSDEIDAPLKGGWSKHVPRLNQMLKAFKKYQNPVIAAYPTDNEGTKKYGIIEGNEVEKNVWQVKKYFEKPGPKKTYSRLTARGCYILTPDIFAIMKKLSRKLKHDQEFYLTDAILALSKQRPVYAKLISNKLYDTGNVLSWLKANVELGLRDKEIGKELRSYLNIKT